MELSVAIFNSLLLAFEHLVMMQLFYLAQIFIGRFLYRKGLRVVALLYTASLQIDQFGYNILQLNFHHFVYCPLSFINTLTDSFDSLFLDVVEAILLHPRFY